MATIHGVAGEWARVRGTVLGLWPLFLGVFFAGASACAALFMPGFVLWGTVLFVLSLVGCAGALQHGLRRVERFFKGARGEEHVSEILKSLSDDYHVFNDYLASGLHIDHVVVGPAGVFAVETKCWRGRVTLEDGHVLVDGQLPTRSPLAQVLKEARAVRDSFREKGWLGDVTPLLAFASDTFEAKIAEAQGTVIVNANHLRESFAGERNRLAPNELERLVRLMEISE